MKKYLPIGTVVQLREAKKSLMIIGALETTNDGREYDYISCPFPEGYVDEETFFLFNQEDIEKVHFVGYVNTESQQFNMMLSSEEFRQIMEQAMEESESSDDGDNIEAEDEDVLEPLDEDALESLDIE